MRAGNGGEFWPARPTTYSAERAVQDLVKMTDGQLTEDQARAMIEDDRGRYKLWRNNVYTVAVYSDPMVNADGSDAGAMLHLSIKRNDRAVIHDWRDLQDIKNALAGPEREAVEIYPAESRRVDSANQYHLWVLPEGVKVPFGFNERLVVDAMPGTLAKQRPL